MKPIIALPARLNTEGKLPRNTVNTAYLNAVTAAGGVPVAVPLLEGIEEEGLMARADGLLLTGGGDIDAPFFGEENHPTVGGVSRLNDETEFALLKAAMKRGKPVFGVCRGIQVINVALGGTLWQDIPSQVGTMVSHNLDYDDAVQRRTSAHPVEVKEGSRLAGLLGGGEAQVNSFHHQCIKDLAQGLRATAWAPDALVEAVETPDGSILAVQWHPEELAPYDPAQAALFRDLVERCMERM